MNIAVKDIVMYSEKIVNSTPSARVSGLIRDTWESINTPKEDFLDYGSILNEETKALPMIIRKAMAERQKLTVVPAGIWDNQIFAGCMTFKNGNLHCAEKLPIYCSEEERLEGERKGHGIYSMFGHVTPDYPLLLTAGVSGIRAKVESRLVTETDQKSRDFLQAVLISLEGVSIFAKRHSEFAFKKAEETADEKWKGELLRCARALERCPEYPAETYFEACQATWLVHLALQHTANRLSIGRTDQFLNPYLEADLQAGRLTLEDAQEITDCFLLKYNERTQDNRLAARNWNIKELQERYERNWRARKLGDEENFRDSVLDIIDIHNHWLQNFMIGGIKPEDGSDASNLTTSLILESFRRIRMTNPVLSVRLHKGTPDWLYRQSAITLKTGGGLPAMYNDEVVIDAYTKFGIPLENARDYTNNGCWEIIIAGKTDFYFCKLNMLKCMEWTLNHGVCHVDGKAEVPDQGDPADFSTFEIFFDKVLENVRIVAKAMADRMETTHPLRSTVAPTPLLSALLAGTIENGRDKTDLGTQFVIGGIIAEAASHTIDSFCAINKLVYQDKKYTMSQLTQAIDADFVGYDALHTDFAACPKYGSNDPVANEMGKRFITAYSNTVKQVDAETPHVKMMPGLGTFAWYIAAGAAVGASADGRKMGAPVASNFSPSAGAMINGITGALHSFSHMALDLLPMGSPIDLGMAERYVTGDEGTNRLMGLMKSFVELNGNLFTISVADTSTLKKAMEKPEDYQDLRVRMGGWSAYFTMLSKPQQEHHIRKSEMGIF